MFKRMKKSIALLLVACMALTLLPPPVFAAGDDSIVQGDPVATVEGGTTYKLSNLEVKSAETAGINTILVSVDTGTFDPKVSSTTLGTVKELTTVGTGAGMTRTYIIDGGTTVALAQDFLRGIEFTLADATTPQNISVTTDRNTTALPAGMTMDTLMINDKPHYYGFVSGTMGWYDAYNKAKTHTLMGMKGYLVTITDPQEDVILDQLDDKVEGWSGGTRDISVFAQMNDADSYRDSDRVKPHGEFYWACGPEAGKSYWSSNDSTGSPVDGAYVRWGAGEPNGGVETTGESCMTVHAPLPVGTTGTKLWNDVMFDHTAVHGYFVEFGGYDAGKDPGKPESAKTATSARPVTKADLSPVPLVNSMSNITVTAPPATVLPGKAVTLKLAAGSPGYYLPSAITVTDHTNIANPANIAPTKYTRAADGRSAELIFTVPTTTTGQVILTGGTFQAPKPMVTVTNAGTTYTMTATPATTAPGGVAATATEVQYAADGTSWQTYTTELSVVGSNVAKAYRFRQISTVDAISGLLSAEVVPAVGYQPTKLINGSFEQPIVSGNGRFIYWEKAGPEFGWRSSEEDRIELVPREAWNAGYGVDEAKGDKAGHGEVFAEMNLEKPTVLYQIIATEPGEVIQWSLQHRGRSGADRMSVYFFPVDSIANLPKDTITNTALLSASALQETFETNNTGWAEYKDYIYVVPKGQKLTCFAFKSVAAHGGHLNSGNLIDDIRFETVLSAITVTVDPVNPNSATISGYSAGKTDTKINYGIFATDANGNTTGPALNTKETSFVVPANKGSFEEQIPLTEIPAGKYVIKAYTDLMTEAKASVGSFMKKSPAVNIDVAPDGNVTITVVPKDDASATASNVYFVNPVNNAAAAPATVVNGKATIPAGWPGNAEQVFGGPYIYVKGKDVATGDDIVTRTNYITTGGAHKSSKAGIAINGTTTMTDLTDLNETLKLVPARSGKVEQWDGTAWQSAVMVPAYRPKNITMRATPGDGAYLAGFEIKGKLCTEYLQAGQLLGDKLADLNLTTGRLTFTATGEQHVYAVYRNLLGEINAATTTAERKALLDDAKLASVFTKGAETIAPMHTEYGKLNTVNQAKVAELLGSMKPTAGYTYAEFIEAYNSAVELFVTVANAGKLNENDYTSGTWAELVKAKAAADAILNATSTPRTVAEVNAAKAALETAMEGLQFKVLTLLVKSPEAQKAVVKVDAKTIRPPVTFRTLGMNEASMVSESYFPVIGTDVTITLTKTDYAGLTMTAAFADGTPLNFTDKGATVEAVIPAIQKSTTVVFNFVGKTVNLTLPTVPGLGISTDGKTDESGKVLAKDEGKDIVLTLTPETGKILVPGSKIEVTIGGVKKEYTLNANGTVTIPGAGVTGDVMVSGNSLSAAMSSPSAGAIQVLVDELKAKYAGSLVEYTPLSTDALQKAIAAVEAELVNTTPDMKTAEALYKAALTAESKLVRQYIVLVTNVLEPVKSGTKPAGWNEDVYGAGKAEFVAPGVTKVTTAGTARYYVETAKSIVLTGTTTPAENVATGATYTEGVTPGKIAVVTDKNGTHTVSIANITGDVRDIDVTTSAKTIVINPGEILPPEGGNTGSITPGTGAGSVVLDPGAGNKVTDVVIDSTTVHMPDDALLAAIREAIKDKTANGTVTIHYPTAGDNMAVTVEFDVPVGKITGTVTVGGKNIAVTVDQTSGFTELVTITGSIAPDDVETITLDPDSGKVTVQFPPADTGSHTVGGKTQLKTHGVSVTGTGTAPAAVAVANEPVIAAVAKDKFAESHAVVITLTPAKDMKVDPKAVFTYVVTNPVSGKTATHVIDPAAAPDDDGSFTVDPATGVITVNIPAKHAVGAITLPMDNLKNNILSADLLRLKELAKIAADLLAQKANGTYTATPDQWNAIDATYAGSPAKIAADIIAGTDTTTAVKDAVKALEDAIKAVTDGRTDTSKLPGTNPTPGTGITAPDATITTPDGAGNGGNDGNLTMPGDNLVITPISTEPGYVPDEVIITVKDPVTGKETEVKIPLDHTNTTGNNPYTATITPDQKVKPGDKTLQDVLNELKPGEITDITVTGKKSGIVLPTIDAILALSNGKTGHTNGASTTSGALSVLTITPEDGAEMTDGATVPVIPENKGVSLKATLGMDDYSQITIPGAINWPYAFSGVKVNGKLLVAADYTAQTVGGIITITFTAEQLKALGNITALEIVTMPTNPQYNSFVTDYARVDALYTAYAKPGASAKDRSDFETIVASLLQQFNAPAYPLKLTPDNRAHLADKQAQLKAFADAIEAKRAASQVGDMIDKMYDALNKSTTAAGDPLPVADPITEEAAKAVLQHEAAINAAKDAFNKLTPAQQNEVSVEQQKKLKEAEDALQKAKNFGKTPDEILKDLIAGLPMDILKNPADAKQGLKDTMSHGGEATKNIYGIDETKTSLEQAHKDALKKLTELDLQLEAIEKLTKTNVPTLAEKKLLDDLRTAINKEYADYAQLFANTQLTDTDKTPPAVDGTYPTDKITDWGKYPEELIDAKSEFDKLPQKVQDAVNKLTGAPTIDDLAKTEFPDVVRPTGLTAESILIELDKDAGAGTDYVKVADMDSTGVVAPSDKTGAEWAESIVKTYEKYLKLTAEEQAKVNAALSEGNKMEDLYNKAKNMVSTSTESQTAAEKFIKYHLTVGGKVILTATDANKSSILGGEADWNKLSDGAKKAVNDKLAALGGKSYPVLLADAKALGSGNPGSGGSGGNGGNGCNGTGTVVPSPVADPNKTGVANKLNTTDHMGYLLGDETGAFRPDSNMTRAEVAQMFYRLLKNKDAGQGTGTTFSDVPADAWYAEAVNALAGMGVLNGYGDGRFGPDAQISRAEFIAVAARFASKVEGVNRYRDVQGTHWALEEIITATVYGWIGGYPDGTFRPTAPINRSEAVKIVNAMLGRSGDKSAVDAATGLKLFSDVEKNHWAYYEIMEATNRHNHKKTSGVETWIR